MHTGINHRGDSSLLHPELLHVNYADQTSAGVKSRRIRRGLTAWQWLG